mgnify:CR=1 FL=1
MSNKSVNALLNRLTFLYRNVAIVESVKETLCSTCKLIYNWEIQNLNECRTIIDKFEMNKIK